MSPEDRPGADIEVVDELRFLAESLRRVDAATATAHFDDEEAMARVVAEAHADLTFARDAVEDILAAGTTHRRPSRRRGGAARHRGQGPAPS
jgi:hypothetical protein